MVKLNKKGPNTIKFKIICIKIYIYYYLFHNFYLITRGFSNLKK